MTASENNSNSKLMGMNPPVGPKIRATAAVLTMEQSCHTVHEALHLTSNTTIQLPRDRLVLPYLNSTSHIMVNFYPKIIL